MKTVLEEKHVPTHKHTGTTDTSCVSGEITFFCVPGLLVPASTWLTSLECLSSSLHSLCKYIYKNTSTSRNVPRPKVVIRQLTMRMSRRGFRPERGRAPQLQLQHHTLGPQNFDTHSLVFNIIMKVGLFQNSCLHQGQAVPARCVARERWRKSHTYAPETLRAENKTALWTIVEAAKFAIPSA